MSISRWERTGEKTRDHSQKSHRKNSESYECPRVMDLPRPPGLDPGWQSGSRLDCRAVLLRVLALSISQRHSSCLFFSLSLCLSFPSFHSILPLFHSSTLPSISLSFPTVSSLSSPLHLPLPSFTPSHPPSPTLPTVFFDTLSPTLPQPQPHSQTTSLSLLPECLNLTTPTTPATSVNCVSHLDRQLWCPFRPRRSRTVTARIPSSHPNSLDESATVPWTISADFCGAR
ncbi:hypothetical protein BJX96DRAFT_131703 [Aspergillus floccosus]